MRRLKYIFLLLSVLCVSSAWSQAIRWEMTPRRYASIERYGLGLFQVKSTDGKIGLIRSDGTELLPPSADQISPFYEHRAVALRKEGGRYLILGVLNDDGSFHRFSTPYYIIKHQIFFSEGLMTVVDGNGRHGYIDDLGGPVLGFDGKWTEIAPFSEGIAAVTGPSGFKLINSSGREVPIVLGLDEIGGGTNVYNGKAVIWNAYGDKFYSFDVKSQKSSKIGAPRDLKLDYLHCLQSVSGRAGNPPYVKVSKTVGTQGLRPVQTGDLWGYADDDRVYLPAQFLEAEPFADKLAIVRTELGLGILRWEDNGSAFASHVSDATLKYKAGQSVPLNFRLDVPAVWQSQPLDVKVLDSESGALMESRVNGAGYTFDYKPQGSARSFQVSIASNGLRLWDGDIAYRFLREVEEVPQQVVPVATVPTKPVKVPEPVIRINKPNPRANADNKVLVTAVVTNASNSELTMTVTIQGSENLRVLNKTITLKPNGTESVVTYFTVTEKLTDQRVEVTTSMGGQAQITIKELIPFY